MITICYRRLDRVTLLRRYTSPKAVTEFNGTLGVAFAHAENKFLTKYPHKHSTVFSKSYDGKEWGTGVSFRFFSLQKKPAIAISCTPAILAQDDWVDFNSLIETMFNFGVKEVWEEFKVSKLEVAMDVAIPFAEMVCFSPGITATDTSCLKDGTMYIGARYGRRSFCIYDKRKQLLEKKKFKLGKDLTRVEVRLRSLGKSLSQFANLDNPFGKLIAVRKSGLVQLAEQYPLDFELRAFVKSSLAGGIAQHAYLDLDIYTRKRLVKLLRSKALPLNGDKSKLNAWLQNQLQHMKNNLYGVPQCN